MHPALAKIIPMIPALLKKKTPWATLVGLLVVGYLVTGDAAASIDWLWKEPRDVLVDRVEDARDSQNQAAEEFQDALLQFKAVVSMPESELERQYKQLNKAYERSADAAQDIATRIDRVVKASNTLLEEWRGELGDYNDPQLRRLAEQQFDQTREHAQRLIASMRQSESSMQPVLAMFRDQVLYLKHNLNLSAIAALQGEAINIEQEVDTLIAEMNRSIAEADAFIKAMMEREHAA